MSLGQRTVNLLIFEAINFRVLPMHVLHVDLTLMEVKMFRGDLFSRKCLPREYRENKSLVI